MIVLIVVKGCFNMTDKFDWLLCPNCGKKLFKTFDTNFDIEMKCQSCKVVFHAWYEDKKLCTENVGKPRRPNGAPPNSRFNPIKETK